MTEEEATNRFSTKKDSETRKRKKGDKYVVPNNFEKIMYGVVLKKMRKTLTIRQEYVLSNNTKFNFVIKIAH
jgi:Rod binding domain-containing protein